MKKIYALYYKIWEDGKYSLEISTSKTLNSYADRLTGDNKAVIQFNEYYYLSFSRAALVKKAEEIKEGWLRDLQKRLQEVEAIVIK